MSDAKFLRILENCIKFGRICMVENAPLAIDPKLESIYYKSIIKKGS